MVKKFKEGKVIKFEQIKEKRRKVMTDVIRSTPSDQYFAAQPRVVKHKRKYRRRAKEEEKPPSK